MFNDHFHSSVAHSHVHRHFQNHFDNLYFIVHSGERLRGSRPGAWLGFWKLFEKSARCSYCLEDRKAKNKE